MKKTVTFCLLLITLGATAQQAPHHRKGRPHLDRELPVEQRASLLSKKMTLSLGLTDQQQKQVAALLSKELASRQELREAVRNQPDSLPAPTPQARYERLDRHLDLQIAFQRELREILTESQFEQWKDRRGDPRQRHRTGSRRR